jgi:hypothetical protein
LQCGAPTATPRPGQAGYGRRRLPSRDTGRSVNVAYIISAYRLPELLVRLVRRLHAPGSMTFIHVDARTDGAVFRAMEAPLRSLPNVHFLPRHPCHWGDFGHVRATLTGLRALIESRRPFDYVVLLTGQDYPIRSNVGIRQTLVAAGGRVFMDWMPVPNDVWSDGGLDRFENRHFRIGRRRFAFPGAPFGREPLNALWTRAARALHLHRDFPAGMQPFGGSSYWMMPADCARYVDEFVRAHPGYVRFFQNVLVPDEMFFQSIVLNSPFRDRVAEDDLRYIDWSENLDHPHVLTSADFDALMRSGKLFARKFDPGVDAAVLDRIDARLDLQ